MMPYYPARDGHPSMFTLDDNATTASVGSIHSTIQRAVLFARLRDLERDGVIEPKPRARSVSISAESTR
jgi:hypothetical protein